MFKMKEINNLNDLENVIGFEKLNKFFTEYSMLAIGKMMENNIGSVSYLTEDQYGNNTNFSDNALSDMTIKGLLGKWTGLIASDINSCLDKYYMKTRNIDYGDKNFVINLFNNTSVKISNLTPVLEDLVNKNIYGVEDIFIVVYGVDSDEVYALRRFLELNSRITEWDEDYMWNNCGSDKRMLKILT